MIVVGFAVIKMIRKIQIKKMEDKEDGTISWEDIKRELEEDGLKKKAKPIKKEDIRDWLRSLLD